MIDILTQLPPGTPLLKEASSELIQALLAIMQLCQVREGGALNTGDLLASISLLAPHLVVPRLSSGERVGYQSQQDAAEFLLWLLDMLHSICRATQEGMDNSQAAEEKAMEIRVLEEERISLVQTVERINPDNVLHDSLDRLAQVDRRLLEIRDHSPVHDICRGQLIEARKCQHCHKISVNVEYFTILPLPVPASSVELEHCFQLFCDVEDLTKDSNMLHCSCVLATLQNNPSNGGLTPGKRLALLSKLPRRLVLQLTRFSYDTSRKVSILMLCFSVPMYPIAGNNGGIGWLVGLGGWFRQNRSKINKYYYWWIFVWWFCWSITIIICKSCCIYSPSVEFNLAACSQIIFISLPIFSACILFH